MFSLFDGKRTSDVWREARMCHEAAGVGGGGNEEDNKMYLGWDVMRK